MEGFHTDMPAAAYHADPAPKPSLSSSIAKIIVEQSPFHAWYCHPRLNAKWADSGGSRRMDLGSVAHEILLASGRGLAIIEADSYRTKAAQEARDAAREQGLTPVLTADHARASAMVEIAKQTIASCRQLGTMFFAPAAVSELVAIWREGGAWCRCMIDRTDMNTVLDYKTVTNAAPAKVARHIYDMGYHIQRGFYLRGLDALDPEGAGRRRFLFVAQEIDPPYACSIHELDGAGASLGQRQVERAIAIWQDCIAADRWPSYPALINRAELPPWIENSLLAQELRDEDAVDRTLPSDLLMGG